MFSNLSTSLLATSQWCLAAALVIVAIWAADEVFFSLLRKRLSRTGGSKAESKLDHPSTQNSRIAIIVPGWREATQLSETVASLVESLDENSTIFIGSWTQDQKTHAEALKLSCQFSNVHHCDVSNRHIGVVSACINDVVAFIRGYEDDTGEQFDGYLIHEPGTALHPLALNHIAEELRNSSLVRLPITVVSDSENLDSLAAGVESDSRAEFFYRELSTRAALGTVSGEGMALAFSADVLQELEGEPLFEVASLDPSYELSQRLRGYGHSTISAPVRFDSDNTDTATKGQQSLVGVTGSLKDSFGAIVRDRSRRLLATSASRQSETGESAGWAYRYGLWRDRREVILGFQLSVALGVALFGFLIACALGAKPQLSVLTSWPALRSALIAVAIAGIVTRLISRHLAVARMPGVRRLARVIPHLVADFALSQIAVGLTVLCWWRGLRRAPANSADRFTAELRPITPTSVLNDRIASKTLPGRPIGELLIDWNVLSHADRDEALAEQMRSGQQLGRILIEQGLVSERTVIEAVAHQISVETVELDVAEVPASFGTLLSHRSMLKYRVCPFSYSENGEIMLACYRLPQPDAVLALREELGTSIRLCLAKRTEVRKLLRLYSELSRNVDRKFMQASPESIGRLAERSRLQAAIRRRDDVADSGRRLLGEQLVLAGHLDRRTLRMCLLQAAGKDQSLRDYLVDHGVIASTTVDALVERITRRAGVRLVSVNGSFVSRERLASAENADSEVV